jgi:hypothetical protein
MIPAQLFPKHLVKRTSAAGTIFRYINIKSAQFWMRPRLLRQNLLIENQGNSH